MVTISEVEGVTKGAQAESSDADRQRLIAEGNSLFVDEDWQGSLDRFTQANDALKDRPSAEALSRRAAVHIKMQNFEDAVADAQKAIELHPSALAYLRKGVACFELEEHETALAAFQDGLKLDPSSSSLRKWMRKAQAELGETESDNPSAPSLSHSQPRVTAQGTTPATSAPAPSPAQLSVPAAPAPRYRHEFYQSSSQVVITVFAKGVKQDELSVEFGEQVLSVTIQGQGEEEPYVLALRLFGKIKPAESKYSLLSTKVEVRLAKAEAIQWTGLEAAARAKAPAVQPINVSTEEAVKSAYPTSSKQKVDWNKLEQEVKKEEKEEKLDGEAGLNKFFQEIYGDSDEETRRAMNKSFVESGGTVLSTNWKDVGKKKVEAKT